MVGQKTFAIAALNLKKEAFIVYVVLVEVQDIVYLFWRPLIALLLIDKARIELARKYGKYIDIFFQKTIAKLPEHTRINYYSINLKKNKQLHYKSIYSLEIVGLETLKTFIKLILRNKFIKLFKSSAKAFILFVKKLDGLLRLYIDYQVLNKLTIKIWYLFLLIGKLLDWLGCAI